MSEWHVLFSAHNRRSRDTHLVEVKFRAPWLRSLEQRRVACIRDATSNRQSSTDGPISCSLENNLLLFSKGMIRVWGRSSPAIFMALGAGFVTTLHSDLVWEILVPLSNNYFLFLLFHPSIHWHLLVFKLKLLRNHVRIRQISFRNRRSEWHR